MPSLVEIRATLVALGRRHGRVAHEAEDLAHDVIVSALRRGLPLEGEAFSRSVSGAARQHAAFLARGAARRRAREAIGATELFAFVGDEYPSSKPVGTRLDALSEALRATLLLLCAGLDKRELLAVLGVEDATLRKRFQALRGRAPLCRDEIPVTPRAPLGRAVRRGRIEVIARLTRVDHLTQRPARAFAASDPDGHGLIFLSEPLTPVPPAATPSAGSTARRARAERQPC